MVENKKEDSTIYIDYKTDNVIISRKGDNDSYSFYATKIDEYKSVSDIDFSNLKLIDNIFDYIEENNIEISGVSKEMPNVGEKKYGK